MRPFSLIVCMGPEIVLFLYLEPFLLRLDQCEAAATVVKVVETAEEDDDEAVTGELELLICWCCITFGEEEEVQRDPVRRAGDVEDRSAVRKRN